LGAKQSVSDLSHRDDAFARLDLERALGRTPRCMRPVRRAGVTGIDARERGVALHLIMETLDLSRVPTPETIGQHGQALVRQGRLREELLQALDLAAIVAFYQGPTGRQCFAPDTRVWREWPFTLAVPVGDLPAATTGPHPPAVDDFVIVQGIVDLLIQRPQGILIVDYKTDVVTRDALAEHAQAYQGQLDLYARAVQGIMNREVIGKVLYFTALRQEVPLR
jgi:ATP-dependent helicase/nuclease subunit A